MNELEAFFIGCGVIVVLMGLFMLAGAIVIHLQHKEGKEK